MAEPEARPLPTRDRVESFIFNEAALLDQRRLEDWAALFADDGRYWVPAQRGGGDPAREVSIVYDTKSSLRVRLAWLRSGRAYAQDPASVTLHQTTNVLFERDAEGLLDVRCTSVVWETRPNTATIAVPTSTRYVLHDDTEPWQIALKYVELLDYRAHYENLTFLL